MVGASRAALQFRLYTPPLLEALREKDGMLEWAAGSALERIDPDAAAGAR
jgi:hypothetical protein